MNILVLNSGSSTLKCSVVDAGTRRRLSSHLIEWAGADGDTPPALPDLAGAEGHPTISAVAHRVVHGGPDCSGPARLDRVTVRAIENAGVLAPLHNARSLAVIRAAGSRYPGLPQIAVFDTAFHHELPEQACRYAVPAHWHEQYGVRRYGFHGISHESVARQAATWLQRPLHDLRLITLHLGNGASATAIAGGRSIDTSMGMTPLEGLVMGTRSGDVDISAALHVARRAGLSLNQLEHALTRQSGLAGLCGDADLRVVMSRSEAGDTDAQRALSVYCYRIRKYIGAYLAALGGADALVFTGGVGENVGVVRAKACEGLEALGIVIDCHKNAVGFSGQARAIHAAGAPVAVFVMASDEDLEIARQACRLLAGR